MDRSQWTAPMWQARLTKERNRQRGYFLIDTMVPEPMRARVRSHFDGVLSIRDLLRKKQKAKEALRKKINRNRR